MKGLIISDVEELFSQKDLECIARDFGFSNRDILQASLNQLCSAYKMYAGADKPLTGKDARRAYGAISDYAEKLASALDIPLYESAVLHSGLGLTRQSLQQILSDLSFRSDQCSEAIKVERPGRKMSVENDFITELLDLYRFGTGLEFDDIVFDETAEPDVQYRGNSLSFLRRILLKVGVRKTDGALVQLIKRNRIHK